MKKRILSGMEYDILMEVASYGKIEKEKIGTKFIANKEERKDLMNKLYAFGYLNKIEENEKTSYVLSKEGRKAVSLFIYKMSCKQRYNSGTLEEIASHPDYDEIIAENNKYQKDKSKLTLYAILAASALLGAAIIASYIKKKKKDSEQS